MHVGWLLVLFAALLACGDSSSGPGPLAPADPYGTAGRSRPPSITDIDIYPRSPTMRDTLSLQVEVQDPERDAVSLDVSWIRNGQRVHRGPDLTLDLSNFYRGDEIWADVRASDGTSEVAAQSDRVQIANLAPEITRLEVLPEEPNADDTLMAVAQANDPEGDAVELTYRWWQDGREIEGQTGVNLPPGILRRGEAVHVSVLASDADTESEWVDSEMRRVVNAPPKITSTPTYELASPTRYEYSVHAEDPDHDPVRYELVKGPPGMRIDLLGGQLGWEIPSNAAGAYDVEVSVTDTSGAQVRQRYSLQISWDQPPASSP